MYANTIHAPGDIRWEEVADPFAGKPTDAVVRVVVGCVCGSDLWRYRGLAPILSPGATIGHECVGEVIQVGDEVSRIRVGDIVIVPFLQSCGDCVNCRRGALSACVRAGQTASGQGELARVQNADGCLTKVGESGDDIDDARMASYLALTDVMATGWHAAVSSGLGAAGAEPGGTAVVVGDGAVGLCGVLAASVLGAERIVALSRHADRQALAVDFGATDIIPERGAEAEARLKELTEGLGADYVLECVGTTESLATAFAAARPGSTVGFVGVPNGVDAFPMRAAFVKNVGLRGGMAAVATYLPRLVELVDSGRIDPGRVFDQVLPMADAIEGYRAMDERRAIKTLLKP